MHLSLLSDAILSDLLNDSGQRDRSADKGLARQHLDGLVRGLVFASALMIPVALTFVPAALGHTQSSPASFEVRP